jgi:folate-binding protein YgfZ
MHHSADRTILKVTGKDCYHFLNGLITNEIRKLKDGLVYAALLTPQGKYIADFLLVGVREGVLIDAHSSLAAPLFQRLSMYKLRADVEIEQTNLKVMRGVGELPSLNAYPDPRHPALGWRLYGEDHPPEDQIDWDAIRVEHCIPETGVELTPETYILEAGFEALSGVDFHKGCYVGQEVTARMKHKTELRKGFRTVSVEGAAPVGTEIIANGKAVGQLFTQADGKAIAYLRFDRISEVMTAGDALVRPI